MHFFIKKNQKKLMAIFGAAIIGISLLPSKRGHQD